MHNSYSLKYRTFDQLFEDVSIDFKNYTLEGLVDPQNLLKVARRCNYMLGFRIYRTRQIILEVERGRVRLPDDFHVMNFAVVCGETTITEALPQGTHIEERLLAAPDYACQPATVDSCSEPDPCTEPDPCNKTCITKCGDEFQLIQKINTTTRSFSMSFPLHITDQEQINKDCVDGMTKNMFHQPSGVTGLTPLGTGPLNEGRIENGFLKVNFDCGKVYINYMGDMIDDDGNILVPDHELLNEYYEYALKDRILENLVMNGEQVGDRYNLIKQQFRAARNNALTVVNTPNFAELQKLWQSNRKAQYSKYYDMFKSYWPYSYSRYGYQR